MRKKSGGGDSRPAKKPKLEQQLRLSFPAPITDHDEEEVELMPEDYELAADSSASFLRGMNLPFDSDHLCPSSIA